MSVELSPANQLGFPRPLTSLVKRSLLIHNPNPHPVAFKVKTTAPKQYCVRPNSGRVESGESVEVQVLLQPLQQEPPPHAKCKDKFLVQSAYITPDEEMHTLGEMWSQVEKTNKSAIHEQKIKVVYLAAEDGSTGQNGIPEEDDHVGEASRLEESAIFSHAQSSPSQPLPPAHDKPIPVPVQVSPPSTAVAPAPQSPPLADLTPAQAGATNIALEKSLNATTSDSEKLSIALKEIEKLKSELEEAKNGSGPQVTGLRKRNTGATSGAETVIEKAKEAVTTSGGQQGVPLEVVAGLVVGVFVLTYLFF
ncbi:MSP domain-containing protein [Kwoniella mangroviensis CBS 8886]|nr:MSP domain-containing protein [Kwoniella mangroviensis CBS 8507]OCF69644.1 MSP domain-containing protein [Kwoniella mangroviensis CBS 8507]OCF70855.1 MSP domain-containing protein [Kwoniella mangroviensis CBS 8886]